MSHPYDLTVIGAGIVGLATAYAIANRYPRLKIAVLEKENDVAKHQTGNNSGVLHAGIYYKPGSLKAKMCVQGKAKMEAFCEENNIEYLHVGKLIVAVDDSELPRLHSLYERGIANGVPGMRVLSQAEMHEIEPYAGGIAAVHSPYTGIVNFRAVSHALRDQLKLRGCDVQFMNKVEKISQPQSDNLTVVTSKYEVETRHLINCGGLYADTIAQMMNLASDIRVIPFRGEYFFLKKEKFDLVRGLIYPVPDPAFPFLGVHFTRVIRDAGLGVEAGPNAVFAFAREGYRFGKINLAELSNAISFIGFQRLAVKHWRMGLAEMRRSLSKALFVKSLQRMIPSIQSDDLEPGGAGVRAMAIHKNGDLVDDFYFVGTKNALHVLNAPSPAATASLTIGEYITEKAGELFGL